VTSGIGELNCGLGSQNLWGGTVWLLVCFQNLVHVVLWITLKDQAVGNMLRSLSKKMPTIRLKLRKTMLQTVKAEYKTQRR
jgi:hypothetical protein